MSDRENDARVAVALGGAPHSPLHVADLAAVVGAATQICEKRDMRWSLGCHPTPGGTRYSMLITDSDGLSWLDWADTPDEAVYLALLAVLDQERRG